MNRYLLLFFSALITSLTILTGCQDEDFGFTQEEVFKGAYERNFEAKYGKIDPNQSWDLSTHARNEWADATRALGDFVTTNDGYFEIDKSMVNWIESKLPNNKDNSSTENFGIIMSAGEFAIIPLYENGNTDLGYELHMVVHDGTSEVSDQVVWTRSKDASRNTIQIKKSTSDECTICHGHGYYNNGGSATCGYCNGQKYFPGGSTKCPVEGCVNGIITSPCPNSNCKVYSRTDNKGRDESIKCDKCNGRGYYWQGFLDYQNCTVCGGEQGWWVIGGKRGSGHPICTSCNGAHQVTRNCGVCKDGKVTKCPVCNASGTGGVLCTTCEGTGSTSSMVWADLKKDETTAGANAIRTKPTYVDNSSASAGSVVYFYLKATNDASFNSNGFISWSYDYAKNQDKQSSLDNKMKVIKTDKRPANISPDPETGYRIIGVEEQSRNTDKTNKKSESPKDYNDLVFMIVGKPLPQVFEIQNTANPIPLSTIEKRYMFEDLGSAIDWDFNDIVVDAIESKSRKLNVSSGVLNGYTDSREAMATIKYLCGTLPLKVSFGDGSTIVSFPKISDPTNQSQTNTELENNPDNPVTDPQYNGTGNPGWAPKEIIKDSDDNVVDCLEYSISIKDSNWTPSNNKVSISVWMVNKTTGEQTSTGQSVWMSSFPENGEVPYIIATDKNVEWKEEGESITSDWWTQNAHNAGNSSELY